MDLFNDYVTKKLFWFNTDNWLIKSDDEKYISLKQTFLDTIIRIKNVKDLPVNIVDDIDCLACLLHTHIINSTILVRKINCSSLVKNHEHVVHLLNMGIVDDEICQSLFQKSHYLKKNSGIAKKILTTKNDYFYFSFYKKLLKDENFVLSLFEDKKFNNCFSLISLPYHKKISEVLILRNSFPNNKTEELQIKYNLDILENVKLLTKVLRKPTGHDLYRFLPPFIRQHKNICLTMLKYHPEYDIENNKYKTLKNFKSCSRFWFYYNDFISQIKFFGQVFDNEEYLFEALQCLKQFKRTSRFCAPDYSLKQHCFINYIKSSSSILFKEFLKTEKGRYILDIASTTSADFNKIDDWLFEELFVVLDKIKLYNKMSQLKALKKEKKLKI